MNPVKIISGIAAPLLRINVDTDAIIPSREIKAVSKKGLSEGLFSEWRYTSISGRKPNDEFVLNREPYNRSAMLLTGDNFGCGSSREHAVWALMDYGFDVVISTSFADIFYGNCFKNGLLPVQLPPDVIDRLFELSSDGLELSVDLPNQTVTEGAGEVFSFDIDQGMKTKLLEGQDEISLSLKEREKILLFEEGHKKRQPWLFDRKSG